MSSSEAAAITALGLMLSLCVLVAMCMRDTAPAERPTILRALSMVLRSLWPWLGSGTPDRTDEPRDR